MGIISIEIEYCNIDINTDKGVISIGVSTYAQCCETFGVRMIIQDKKGKDIGEWEVDKHKPIYIHDSRCSCKESSECKSCSHKSECDCETRLLSQLIGRNIDNITPLYEEKNIRGVSFTVSDNDDTLAKFSGLNYIIEAYVDHNGYYPHEYYVEYPGYSSEGEIDKKPVSFDELVEKLEILENTNHNLSESY